MVGNITMKDKEGSKRKWLWLIWWVRYPSLSYAQLLVIAVSSI